VRPLILTALLAALLWPGAEARAQAIVPVEGRVSGWRLSSGEALALASAAPAVRRERAARPDAYLRAYVRRGEHRWQVSLFAPPHGGPPRAAEVAQVLIDDRSGRVLEAWTGPQVEWTLARGHPGVIGGAINAPWVWLLLCAAFVLPFLRGPPRLLHLDVAVLLGFSGSYAAFKAANLDVSVPTVYPLLGYLLARMLWIAWRGAPAAPEPSRLSVRWLLAGAGALLVFRAALAVFAGDVIDVGQAGVIGAERLAHGRPLYGAFPLDNAHGDAYGPALYLVYVPFALTLPDHAAAIAAAIVMDRASAALCWRAGGARLAYLWAAYPFTALALASGSNDALIAALVLAAILAAARPVTRGALVAVGGLAKLAPFALLPLLATYGRRGTTVSVGVAVVVSAALLAPFDVQLAWERTVSFQATRDSPFSVWGLWGGLDTLQLAVQVAAVALAGMVAFVPRRRDRGTLCALAAAVLIALQLGAEHWFYLYLVWFTPLVLAALLGVRAADR
jgi:hypothetical protein